MSALLDPRCYRAVCPQQVRNGHPHSQLTGRSLKPRYWYRKEPGHSPGHHCTRGAF